jgi:hypothetical protein
MALRTNQLISAVMLVCTILPSAQANGKDSARHDTVQAIIEEVAAQPGADPILWFSPSRSRRSFSDQQLDAIFNAPIESRDPLLARMAFDQLQAPSTAHIQALRDVSADRALLHLALLRLPEAGVHDAPNPTPTQIAFVDQVLREAGASRDFSEGWRETILRFDAIVAAHPKLRQAIIEVPAEEEAKQWSALSAAQVEQATIDIYGAAIAASIALPAYQISLQRCAGAELTRSIDRPLLCQQLGQAMQRRAETLITASIGAALEIKSVSTEHDKALAKRRQMSLRALTPLIFASMPDTSALPSATRIPSDEFVQLEHALSSRAKVIGELSAYMEHFARSRKLVLSTDRFEALEQIYAALNEAEKARIANW